MNCLRPAVGRSFIAKGTTIRTGRKQIFARAELFADQQGETRWSQLVEPCWFQPAIEWWHSTERPTIAMVGVLSEGARK
jgi:hypothetical protein